MAACTPPTQVSLVSLAAPAPPTPPIIQGCGQGTALDITSMQCQISCDGDGGRRLQSGTPEDDETLALFFAQRPALAAHRNALQAGATAPFSMEELKDLLHFRQPAPA